jgi:hypothetical protein
MSEVAVSAATGSLAVDEAVTVELDYKYFKKLVDPVVVSPQVYSPTTFNIKGVPQLALIYVALIDGLYYPFGYLLPPVLGPIKILNLFPP